MAEDIGSFIDERFPDLKSLPNISVLLEEKEREVAQQRQELASFVGTEAALIKELSADAEARLQALPGINSRRAQIARLVKQKSLNSAELVTSLSDQVGEINILVEAVEYLKRLQLLETLSAAVQGSVEPHAALKPFEELVALCAAVRASEGLDNLRTLSASRLETLYKELFGHFRKAYAKALTDLNWPQPILKPAGARWEAFTLCFVDCFNVQRLYRRSLGDAMEDDGVDKPLPTPPPPPPPTPRLAKDMPAAEAAPSDEAGTEMVVMSLLLEPLLRRFEFHFRGDKPTNRPDKPEWFFAHVLGLVRSHAPFLTEMVQPLLTTAGVRNYDARSHFVRGLLGAVREKLEADAPKVVDDDFLLSHTILEALQFEKAMVEMYGHRPHCTEIFTENEQYFERWLDVEKKQAGARFGEIASSATAHERKYAGEAAEGDDMRATVSADAVATLLSSMSERFLSIPAFARQRELVERVQIYLLHDYYVQLKDRARASLIGSLTAEQLARASLLANAAHYIATVVREWGEDMPFLQLRCYCMAVDAEWERLPQRPDEVTEDDMLKATGTVFDAVLSKYGEVEKLVLDKLASSITDAFCVKMAAYRNLRTWKQHKVDAGFELTREFCEPLAVLRERLAAVEAEMARDLFPKVWQAVIAELDAFLYREVVRALHFSERGGRQFRHDMEMLFAVFRPYTARPESLFVRTREAAAVLSLDAPHVLLLLEATQLENPSESADDAALRAQELKTLFAKYGVRLLTKKEVKQLLYHREEVYTAAGKT